MSGIDGSSWGWPVEGDVRNQWQFLGLASRGGCQESMAVPGLGQQRVMSGIDGSSWCWPVEGDVRNRWQFLVLASRGGCLGKGVLLYLAIHNTKNSKHVAKG